MPMLVLITCTCCWEDFEVADQVPPFLGSQWQWAERAVWFAWSGRAAGFTATDLHRCLCVAHLISVHPWQAMTVSSEGSLVCLKRQSCWLHSHRPPPMLACCSSNLCASLDKLDEMLVRYLNRLCTRSHLVWWIVHKMVFGISIQFHNLCEKNCHISSSQYEIT